jgi:hypothetical protein
MNKLQQSKRKQTPWPESASELYRPSERFISAKLMPTFGDRGYRVASATDPDGSNLDFLGRNRVRKEVRNVKYKISGDYAKEETLRMTSLPGFGNTDHLPRSNEMT